ncbi:MAG: hypothetical protein GY804_08660 [Alphaproteobacteria bacterium]|nr:hypothetical protein [Alphaproteobacteria bacterium]
MQVSQQALSLDAAKSGLAFFIRAIKNIDNTDPKALSEFTRPATIESSVIVEKSLMDEDIRKNLASMLNTLYMGYITTALDLDKYIDGGKTVREMLRVVSTQRHMDVVDIINDQFLDYQPTNVDVSFQGNDTSKGPSLFSGKTMKLDVTTRDEQGKPTGTTSITVNVQLLANSLDSSTIELLLKASNKPAPDQRRIQRSAGEISFWRDFLFERDLVKDHRNALKSDKSGFVYEEFKRRANALSNSIEIIATGGGDRISYNSASTILLIESRVFQKILKHLGVNVNDYRSRQNFMSNAYCLMIAEVDLMFRTGVTMYFNGIRKKSQYSFEAIEENYGQKAREKYSFKDILSAMREGTGPSF